MAKNGKDKQTIVHMTHHRKLKNEQHKCLYYLASYLFKVKVHLIQCTFSWSVFLS